MFQKRGSSNDNKTVWTHKLTHLYDVVVKQQPEIVTFHNGDVVSSVRTAEIWCVTMLIFTHLSPTRSNPAVTKRLDFLLLKCSFISLFPGSGCCGDGNSKSVCQYTPATMHHDSDEVVEPLRIGGVPRGVEEAELQGEDDAVGQLGVALQLLHVFEALQMQSQDHWQLLYAHPATGTIKMRARRARHGGSPEINRRSHLLCASCLLLHSSQ